MGKRPAHTGTVAGTGFIDQLIGANSISNWTGEAKVMPLSFACVEHRFTIPLIAPARVAKWWALNRDTEESLPHTVAGEETASLPSTQHQSSRRHGV